MGQKHFPAAHCCFQVCFFLFYFTKKTIQNTVSNGREQGSLLGARRSESSATGLNPDKLQINPDNRAYLGDPAVRRVYDSALFM